MLDQVAQDVAQHIAVPEARVRCEPGRVAFQVHLVHVAQGDVFWQPVPGYFDEGFRDEAVR